MTRLKLAVFDVDGTLMDSQDFIVEAMTRAFGGLGVPLPTREQVLSIVGLSLDRAIAEMMPSLSPADVARAAELYKQSFIAIRAERGGEASAPLYPGARETLNQLAARDEVLLGVATGKAKRGLDHAIRAHGWDGLFLTRQTADDHPSKPHPSMLLKCLADTGAEASDAVMIGDTTFDIEMGRAAGFRTLGVSWGYHPTAALRAAGADLIVETFAGVLPALDELWGTR
jgi:phosphoglycolate phosphatase